jgi:DNA-binding transcriptional regulator YdaS (Cro superfamily)
MDLRTYLKQAPRGTGAELARRLGVNRVMLYQWAGGVKPVPAIRAVALERATLGAVKRWDMVPNWRDHWPELARSKSVPAESQAAA